MRVQRKGQRNRKVRFIIAKLAKPAGFAGLLFFTGGSRNGKLHRLLPGSGAGAKLVGRLIIPQTGILQSKMDYPFIFGISFLHKRFQFR